MPKRILHFLLIILLFVAPATTHARWLSVNTGRFHTMDTYEGDQENPATLHKYLYCHADPVNGTDPTGHFMDMGSALSGSSLSQGIRGGGGVVVSRASSRAVATLGRLMIQRELNIGQLLVDRAFGMALSVLTVEVGVGVGLMVDDVQNTSDSRILYRAMKGREYPELGESALSLGIRDRDIPNAINGTISPGNHGLSVTPNNPSLLPEFALKEVAKRKARVWGMAEITLDPRLSYRPDPAKPKSHGFISPAIPMPVSEYKRLIQDTQKHWQSLTP